MYIIAKEHRFESAHRLVNGYQGNCAHVHGHSWKIIFETSGEKRDQFGMLRDFSSFKEIRKWIDDNLDHATMICASDESLHKWLVENNQRLFVFPDNPTSETLARFLFDQCKALGIKDVKAVTVEETCTSRATYVD